MRAQIRPAHRADASAIARLHVASWKAAHRAVFPEERLAQGPSLAEREGQWRVWLDPDDERPRAAWIAEADGCVVGIAAAGAGDPGLHGGGVGCVYELYVDEEHWGAGTGKRLLTLLESYLRALGFEQAVLWVLDTNARAVGRTTRAMK